MNNRYCYNVYHFCFVFLSKFANHSTLLEPGFHVAKFYCDSQLFLYIDVINVSKIQQICYFTETNSMDSQKVIYKNVEKSPFISQQTYLYTRVTNILKFYAVLFCTYCKGLFCLYKTVMMLIFLCICKKHFQHQEITKNNSKLNFKKNRWAS